MRCCNDLVKRPYTTYCAFVLGRSLDVDTCANLLLLSLLGCRPNGSCRVKKLGPAVPQIFLGRPLGGSHAPQRDRLGGGEIWSRRDLPQALAEWLVGSASSHKSAGGTRLPLTRATGVPRISVRIWANFEWRPPHRLDGRGDFTRVPFTPSKNCRHDMVSYSAPNLSSLAWQQERMGSRTDR